MMDSEEIVEFIENHRDLIKSQNFQKKFVDLIQETKENEEVNLGLEEDYEIKNKLPFEDDYAKGHYDVWLMPWIRDRIARNQNVLGLFIGPTGSGKSYSAMELARSIDSTFLPNKSVYFDVLPFIQEVVRGNLQRGNSLILDDAGVFMNSRDWQSIQNRAISVVAQSFRYRNLITFITVPKWDYIDAQTRGLFNIIFVATHQQGVFKIFIPKEVHKTLKQADTFLTYPRVPKPNSRIYKPITVKTARYRLVLDNIAQEYEAKRAIMIQRIQNEILEELEAAINNKNNKEVDKAAKKIGIKDFVKKLSSKGLSQRDIGDVYGISVATVNRILNKE